MQGISKFLWFSHCFFNSMLFSFHVVVFFLLLFLCLISGFMLVWSEKMLEIKMLEIISTLSFVESWFWSVLENVLCALEKNVYSTFWGMKTSIKSNCYIVLFIISFPVIFLYHFSSVQFSSVTRVCLILCDPMNHSTPGLPVHH